MIAKRLQESFKEYFDAPIETWLEFAELCEIVEFKKNEIMKRSGMTEKYHYYILNGSAGIFIWKENSYVCIDLVYEDEFFDDYMSFITGEPSQLETVALENSEMLRISKDSMNELKQTPIGSSMFLIATELQFVNKQKQQIDLLLKTAEQRYIDLLEKQPLLIQRTQQKHIASYLGITTQSLSRIRKKIADNKSQ